MRQEIECGSIAGMPATYSDFLCSLLANAGQGVCLLDHDLIVRVWSQAQEKTTGLSQQDALGKHIFELLPSLNNEEHRQLYRQVLQGSQVFRTEQPIYYPKPAKQGWYDANYFPLKDQENLIKGIIIIIHDVTDRYLAEQANKKHEELYKLLADNSLDIISAHDMQGTFLYVSPACGRVLGYAQEELLGHKVQEFICIDDLEEFTRAFTTRAGANREAAALRLRKKDQTYCWFETIVQPLTDPHTGQQELQVNWRDITDRKQIEAQVKTKSQLLSSMVSYLPVIVKEFDKTGILTAVYGKGLESLGLENASLQQKQAELASDPRLKQALETAKDGESSYFQEELEHNGKSVFLKSFVFPDTQNKGQAYSFCIDISETKLSESKLLSEQEFINKVSNSTPFIVTVFDVEALTFSYVNQQIENILGYTPDEVKAMGNQLLPSVVHPKDLPNMLKQVEKLKKCSDGELLELEYRLRHKTAGWLWFMGRKTIFRRDTHGNVISGLSVSVDITQQKKDKRLLEGVLRSSLNGIMAFDAVRDEEDNISDFKWILVNPAAAGILGKRAKKWLGQSLRATLQENDSEELLPDYAHVVESGEPLQQERQLLVNGEQRWLDMVAVKLGDGLVVTYTDITQRRLAEEELRSSKQFTDKITRAVPLLLSIFDLSKKAVVYSNGREFDMLGFTSEEIIQLSFENILERYHPTDRARMPEHLQKIAELKDGEIYEYENRLMDKSGTYRWRLSRVSVFSRSDDGSVTQVLVVSQDIDEVRKSKHLLDGILDSSLSGIMAFRAIRGAAGEIRDFEWTMANPESERITGRTEEQLIGKRLLVELPGVKPDGLFDRYVEVVETGLPLSLEHYYDHDGMKNWLHITAVRLEDGFTATFTDITEKKKAEAEARKSQTLLEEAQQMASLGVWEWDLETNQISWSDECYRIFGLAPNEKEIDFNWYMECVHPADREELNQLAQESASSGRPFVSQHRITTEDKTTKTVISKGRILTDSKNNPYRMIGMVMDVTQLVQMRQELEQTRQMHQVAEAIPQIVWTADLEGNRNYFNNRWYAYTGFTAVQSLNMGWTAALHPEDREKSIARWKDAVSQGETFETEFRLRSKDGTYEWFLSRGVLLKDEQGRPLQWFGTSTGIDELKRTQQELEQARHSMAHYVHELNASNQQLKKTNADLDNFIYAASHDLKAPIHNIEGLMRILSDEIGNPSGTVEDVMGMIWKAIARFKTTVLDLTDIIKVERAMQEEATEVSISDVITEIESDISDLINQHGAEIKKELEIDQVLFSRKNLRSILYNLISNGVKYNQPGRTAVVTVRTRNTGNGWFELLVQDNGLGLEEKDRLRLFGMFERFHTHVEGSGIGLYIVKRIVDNAGGQISVESEHGKGTTFRVLLKKEVTVPKSADSQAKA